MALQISLKSTWIQTAGFLIPASESSVLDGFFVVVDMYTADTLTEISRRKLEGKYQIIVDSILLMLCHKSRRSDFLNMSYNVKSDSVSLTISYQLHKDS